MLECFEFKYKKLFGLSGLWDLNLGPQICIAALIIPTDATHHPQSYTSYKLPEKVWNPKNISRFWYTNARTIIFSEISKH